MSKRWRIGGSLVLLGVVAWRLDWGQLRLAFSCLDVRFCALSAGVYLLAQLVSSARWQMLAAPLGFRVGWRQYLSFYFIGMFFNLLLPTSVGGDVVRALYLASGQSRRRDAVLSVFADRASGLAVLVVMACLAGLLSPTPLPLWMAAALAGLAGCVVLGVAALPVLPLLGRLPVVGPKLLGLVDAGRVYLHRPGLLLAATALSIVVQLSSVLMTWLISEGLGLHVPFLYMAVVVPLVTLLTLIPVSVNGMGLREVGMVILLAPLGVAGASAVTVSLLGFAVCAAVSVIGAGLYLFGRHPHTSRVPEGGVEEPRGAADGPGEPGMPREGRFDAEPVCCGSNQGRMRQPPAAA